MTTALRWWLAAFVITQVATGQAGVRLTKVPERVVLPAAAGQNLVVEVEVSGQPSAVWLARDAAAPEQLLLTKAGAGNYQVNLADARVLRLLPADRNLGDLHVFARRDGKLLQSTAIAWARAKPTAKVKVLVVGVDGKQASYSSDAEPWLDLARTERLELTGLMMRQARASAIIDGTTVPFSRRAGRPFSLTVNDGIRKAVFEAGELGIDVQHGGQKWWFAFRIVPDRLEPAEERFSILQRRRGQVPGSNGWLHVRIGDITAGQALVVVTDGLGREVVGQRSLGEGDFVTIPLSSGDYVLVVDRLVNRLIGDDHAELRVLKKSKFRADPIAQLIDRVGKTVGIAFVREGKDHDARMAQRFLRARRQMHRDRQLTPKQFIELASKSSRTGEPYHIRLADGTVVPAAAWFTEQLAAIK